MRFLVPPLALVVLLPFLTLNAMAQDEPWYEQNPLPQTMTPEEELRRHEIGLGFRSTVPPEDAVRSIGEFERNEGVLIRYPLGIPMNLVALMSEHVKVTTIVTNQAQENQVRGFYQNAGVNMDNAEFMHAPSNSYWTRDYGPFYVATDDNQVHAIDFVYNRPRPSDQQVASSFANHLGIPIHAMSLVHTGGNYMSTGWGAAASTDLVWEENGNSQVLVTNTMNDYMGISNYHITIDPQHTYLKHIDTWAKFLDVDKIMIAEVPVGHLHYADHESMADYFEAAVSPWGTPFQVFRVPTPNGQPYANSLIMNERVYVPIANSSWDAVAIAAYEEALPGYEVIGVPHPGGGGWLATDALHCRVKEVPDIEMLSIRHEPLAGAFPHQEEFELEAEIVSYGGHDLIDDELFLIHRSGEAAYDTLALGHVGGHNFAASIPVGEEATEISYYFSAADVSGRVETWPLIGPEGARTFSVDAPPVSTEPGAIAEALEIEALFPNPTRGPVEVRYRLDAPGEVRLEVYDVMGRRVLALTEAAQPAGRHNTSMDTGQLAGGVYFLRLSAGGAQVTERFLVAR